MKLGVKNMFPLGIELLFLPIEIEVKIPRDTNHYSITASANSCFTIQFVVVLHLRVLIARSCGRSGMSRESNSTTLVYTHIQEASPGPRISSLCSDFTSHPADNLIKISSPCHNPILC